MSASPVAPGGMDARGAARTATTATLNRCNGGVCARSEAHAYAQPLAAIWALKPLICKDDRSSLRRKDLAGIENALGVELALDATHQTQGDRI